MNSAKVARNLFLVLCAVGFLLCLMPFFPVGVHATTPEWRYYMRSDQWTVNGITTYELGSTESSSFSSVFINSYVGNVYHTQYVGILPYKRDSSSTETNLTNGAVAIGSASSSGQFNVTWDCPQTALVPTDAIEIDVLAGDTNPPTHSWISFITEQVGVCGLNSSTWTVYYSWSRAYILQQNVTNYYFYFGASAYDSRIEGFSWDAYSAGSPSVNWANANLSYRQSVLITNASGAGVSYQIPITLVNGSSSSSGNMMCESNRMRSDFGDVRFYSNDNTTLLSCYQENVSSGVNSTYWFKMPSDSTYGNLSATNQTIWVYYGNSTMTTASNGNNTFVFYDGFEAGLTSWTVTSATTSTTQAYEGSYSVLFAGKNYRIQKNPAPSYANVSVHVRIYDGLNGTNNEATMFESDSTGVFVAGIDEARTGGTTNYVYRVASTYYQSSVARSVGWHSFVISQTSATVQSLYIDGNAQSTTCSESGVTAIVVGDQWNYNTAALYADAVFVVNFTSPNQPGNGAWTAEELCKPAVSITVTSSSTGSGFVTVDGAAVTTPHTYSWILGDYHLLWANSSNNIVSGQSQYVYSNWSDSGVQTHWIIVPSSSTTFTANFQLQYYLTVTGGDSTSGQGWYNSGVSATASSSWVWNIVSGQSRTALTNWQLDGANQTPSRQNGGTLTTSLITMNTYHTANFVSATQYFLTVSGGNSVSYGTSSPTADNWYDNGTSTIVSSDWVWGTVSGQNRTVLTDWQLDAVNENATRQNSGTLTTSSVSMNTYHTVTFVPTTQYYNTLGTAVSGATVSQSGSQLSDNWYDSGTNTTVSATSPYTNGTTNRFVFATWSWTLGGASQTNNTGNPVSMTMSNYTSVTAYWNCDIVVLYDKYLPYTRVNVGSNQTVSLRYEWQSDNSTLTSGWSLEVNNVSRTTDSLGWTNFTDSYASVGLQSWQLTGANGGSNYLNENISASIIWDKISIALSAPVRYNVNSSAPIAKTATYEYDGTGSNGTVNLNDTTLKSIVAKYDYTAVSVSGDSYGITVFDTNTISIIYDNVTVTLSPSTSRINVGSTASIGKVGVLQYDGTSYDGSISLNDTILKSSVGIWNYTTGSISGGTFNITVFGSNTVQVIFDEVTISTFSVAHSRINVNSSASFTVAGFYCYDNGNWSGTYSLNDTTMRSGEGMYWFTVASITDSNYGLTVFNMSASGLSVTWDSLKVYNLQTVYGGSNATFTSQIIYGYDGVSINNATVGLLYPNGTLVTAYSNSSGWTSFTVPVSALPGGIYTIYGINDNNYGITIATLNETFGGVEWTLQATDVDGNLLNSATITVTANGTLMWSGSSGTSIFVGTDSYNVSVSWLQGLTVNVTYNIAVTGNQTSVFNCTCYPFTIGGSRYWFSGNASVSAYSYVSSELTINFTGPTGTYVLVDSYSMKPSYILNSTYDLATAFSSGYLVLTHFGNETLVIGYNPWSGLYVASTNHQMSSVSLVSYTLSITENGNAGEIGAVSVYCGSWGGPATASGFVTVNFAPSTLTATGSFVFASNTTVLQLTFSGGSPAPGGGGLSFGPPAALLITATLDFPKLAKPGDVLNGTLSVQWSGISIMSLYGVNPVSTGMWIVNVPNGLPLTLTMKNGASGNVSITLLLTVPQNATIGDNQIPFDIVFSALGETTKTCRLTVFIMVLAPLVANLPSPQDMLTISSLALFGLFLAVIIFRRSKRTRP